MSSSSVTTAGSLAPSPDAYRSTLSQLHAQLALSAGGPAPSMAPDAYLPSRPMAPAILAPQGIPDSTQQLWERLKRMVASLLKPTAPAKAPVPASAGSGPTIRLGSHGEAVKALQSRLKQLGFDPGSLDGDFGPQTEAALRAFQGREGIAVDGIVGPESWQHLGIHAPEPSTPPSGTLAQLTPAQLADLGAHHKDQFFAVLRPAAEEAERKYGVPAAVTLAQAALESGWGQQAIGGYNIFGIKGKGPAGSSSASTREYENGHYVTINGSFALYHNFEEAIVEHGKLFHNGYYDKAIAHYQQDPSPFAFVQNIQGIYATDPQYQQKISSIIKTYGLA